MIAEVRLETQLLTPTLREIPAKEVVIEQLDATGDIPLRTICWLEHDCPDAFETALRNDQTVYEASQIATTEQGRQYQITYDDTYSGVGVYAAVVERGGVFLTGYTSDDHWTLRLRFPDREAFSVFREDCNGNGVALSVQAIHERESAPSNELYGISDPQREVLLLAARRGYFEVPRDASLADLAAELDLSSQAVSERLRRGLDSLVTAALLTPE
jgi:predicted DNA binding protein